jgi:hypothetical protein
VPVSLGVQFSLERTFWRPTRFIPFHGRIDMVTIALDTPKLTPDDVKKLEASNRSESD